MAQAKETPKVVPVDRFTFWKERVDNSKGNAVFVPDALREEWDELQKTRKAINEETIKLSSKIGRLENRNRNFTFKLQEYLEKNGHPDIFTKDLQEDADALEEGFGIVHILKPQQRMV